MRDAKDIDLLRLEMRTLWERDAYGRLRPHPLAAVAFADDGWAVRFAPEATDDLRKLLSPDLDEDRIRERFASFEPSRVGCWRSYVFPDEPLPSEPSPLDILTSDDDVLPKLTVARPEAWWESGEWDDLLAGRLGPWAIAAVENRVVALCHTPVGSAVAAEAGVWTHPEFRGRGYAGIVTAAWAAVARKTFDTLFYSAHGDNAASQAVARKLGLRPLGWVGQLRNDG